MKRTKSIEMVTALLLWVLFLYLPVPAIAYLQPSAAVPTAKQAYSSNLPLDEASAGFILFETEQNKTPGSSENNSHILLCESGSTLLAFSTFEAGDPLKPFPGFRRPAFLFHIFPNAP